ncbi:MAG: hypothetical protein ACLVML_00705 [Candidatus Gastranaerophilaceae bacterium]|nr:hypothetical protein [Christensenellales bacterium]
MARMVGMGATKKLTPEKKEVKRLKDEIDTLKTELEKAYARIAELEGSQ